MLPHTVWGAVLVINRWQLGIRTKLMGILALAAFIPLLIAVIVVAIIGYGHYKRETARVYEGAATHLARSLELAFLQPVQELGHWIQITGMAGFVAADNRQHSGETDADAAVVTQALDARWTSLSPDAPELQAVLVGEWPDRLRQFERLNPAFGEIFVTDRRGRLLASTNKTSDYDQADEDWWQQAARLPAGRAFVQGIQYDESARVYSIDICFPVWSTGPEGEQFEGVLKAVLDPEPLFRAVRPIYRDHVAERHVVLADGRVVYRLFGPNVEVFAHRFEPAVLARFRGQGRGWEFVRLSGRTTELVGFAEMPLLGPMVGKVDLAGGGPLQVLMHQDAATVLAPIRIQFLVLTTSGVLLLIGFTTLGWYVAKRHLVQPVQTLREAAMTVAASAKLAAEAPQGDTPAPPITGPAGKVLEAVRGIDTGDELQDLAVEVELMAVRVLRYHEHLEEELRRKTREIQDDLAVAREFQEALMPRSYPQVPTRLRPGALSLGFHHIYQPASTVGGDFFDVLKLSDHQAGIFIADVMGHGARSALVTAILRTLLHDLAAEGHEPARFLALLNQYFHNLMQHSNQLVFVSAFYLVLDTERAIARYASAGHPPPMFADRERGLAVPLIPRLQNNPALGLFRDSHYTTYTSFIKSNDLFLLFTDGLFEAQDPDNQEYGLERLQAAVQQHVHEPARDIVQGLVDSVTEFARGQPLPDDVCLVSVEVTTNNGV